MSDVEETLKRIQSHKGVQGVIIWNPEGIAIRSTFEPKVTTQARLLPPALAALHFSRRRSHVLQGVNQW